MSESSSSWGRVTAAPHQYLIHIRRGRVVAHGQGGSAFRWPGDTVARSMGLDLPGLLQSD